MAVTIKDIARAAGVSHSTVSRALRRHPAIALDTVDRIRQIADELGYIPNTVARGLKTNRSGVLGVIVRRIVDPFFAEVLHGIEDVLHDEGYSLFLAASNRDPDREKEIVRLMSERRVDGVIICSTQVSEQHRRQLERFRVPSVLINNQASEDSAYSVYHDDADGSYQLTRHLIHLGHKRIAYLGNARAGRTTQDRQRGYRVALDEAGVAVPVEYVTDGPNGMPEGGEQGVQYFLALATPPTAIVCYNDVMAIGAMQALQKAGRRVPGDCSVTGFDDIELAAYVNPPLTTFNQPKYELGCQAAKMMLRLLSREAEREITAEGDIVRLRGQMRVRASTAPLVNR